MRKVGTLRLRLPLLLLLRRVAGVPLLGAPCRCMDVRTGLGPERHASRSLALLCRCCRPAALGLPGCSSLSCRSLLLLALLLLELLLLLLRLPSSGAAACRCLGCFQSGVSRKGLEEVTPVCQPTCGIHRNDRRAAK